SLVPENDKSLLLINAGMAPLKPYFTGLEKPPSKRVTTCQKCIRTIDIDNVGITARHVTLFEMLGNFSFGDYFKEEIIPWSWEFCTKVLEMPDDRLFVSVFLEDDEAFNIWRDKVGLPESKIFRMGKEDNFWEVGTGPCGPCSEIYFDRGLEYGCGKDTCTVGCNCDRFMEFWNLVFTQFNREEDGTYTPLSHPNIDTGMGLERMGVIMQNVHSIFDIDTMKSLRDKVCEIAGHKYLSDYNKDISVRIIADHVRSVTFMLADGVLPNNEGRGYVLRRLLRRAARHGKLLGIEDKFMAQLCEVVIQQFSSAYPELEEKKDYILKIFNIEESKFYETLDQGLALLKKHISHLNETKQSVLSGVYAFKMYDTYGFPIELMREILAEEHIGINEEEFNTEMTKQRELSRSDHGENSFMGGEAGAFAAIDAVPTEFVGYTSVRTDNSVVLAMVSNDKAVNSMEKGAHGSIILDKTAFYAESGGQAGDRGIIKTNTGEFVVEDCVKVIGGRFAHEGYVSQGVIKKGDTAQTLVDKEIRNAAKRNHTATHLLHKALRQVLGNHVEQAGSLVTESRLRFDFTHFESMTPAQIEEVEEIVNDVIFDALEVTITNTDMEHAKKMGAMALFGEKYGNEVRVVSVEDFSTELCGGIHVDNTSNIGLFKILSESGISAGVRRIEALTGKNALKFYQNQDEMVKTVAMSLKTTPDNLPKRTEGLLEQTKELKREISSLSSRMSGNIVDDILNAKEEISGVNAVLYKADNMDMNALRNLGDKIKDKLSNGVIALLSTVEDKVFMVVMATDDAVKKGIHAGNIVKAVAPVIGGNGGGKPNMAQAGGTDAMAINDAFIKLKEIIKEQVK
ncbi:MAG: alanine--tRNA ligase, partial [Clostridiales bacterium]|nr:alanine--tRNA ligase [Clostridiales bacterium]